MLNDIVQELHAPVETFVSPRPQQVEGEAEEMKRGLKSLISDTFEKRGKSNTMHLIRVLIRLDLPIRSGTGQASKW